MVEIVDVMDSKDEVNLKLLGRTDLGVTFTKLHCWRLTQFSKAAFLDADTLVGWNVHNKIFPTDLEASYYVHNFYTVGDSLCLAQQPNK